VILKNEQEIAVTNNDLMDPTQFFVRRKCLPDDLNANERKKQSAKQKRARMSEKLQKEKDIHEKAKEQLCQLERSEFDNILAIVRSGNEYCFEDFLEMIDKM